MDKKLKHLEFIQGVINRLSTNSFLLKGWSVVLVSALFALSTQDSNKSFVLPDRHKGTRSPTGVFVFLVPLDLRNDGSVWRVS